MERKFKCPICKKEFFDIKHKYRTYCSEKCNGISKKNIKLSEEHKRKLSIAHKGIKCSNKRREKMRKIAKDRGFGKWMKGRKLSKETKKKLQGRKSHNFKGRKIDKNGYIYIFTPNHPFRNNANCIFEHRLIMEKIIDRYLKPEERVHHKGIKYPINSIENRQDNSPENLMLFDNDSKHTKFHHKAMHLQLYK